MQVFELSGDIFLRDNGAIRGLNDIDSSASRVGGTFNKLAKIIGGLAIGKAFVSFGKSAVTAASDVEELENKFGVVFAGIEESTNSWITNYANATARGEYATKEFIANLQDIRTGYGDTTTKAAAFSKAVVGATNDLSSFSNVDFESASDAIQSGLSGQFEALRKLGVAVNVATIDQGEYAKSIGTTWKDMSSLEKQEAILNEIMKQSANAIGQNITSWEDYDYTLGDAAKTSDSFANQTKLLKQSFTDWAGEIGKVLLPVMNNIVTYLNDKLPSTIPYIKATFETIINYAGAVMKFMKPFTDTIRKAFETVFGVISQLTGINAKVTADNKKNVQERINALTDEKNSRIKALKEQYEAQKNAVKESVNLTKKELETKKEATKEELEERKDAISKARDMQKEALEEALDAEKEKLDTYKETADEAIELREKQLKTTLNAIDEELDAIKKAENEKLEALDKEYMAKLKTIDSEAYAQIEALKGKKEEIELSREMAKTQEREQKEAKKLAELKRKVSDSESTEERREAQKDLSEYLAELERERIEREREANIKLIDMKIKSIETERELNKERLKNEEKEKEDAIKKQAELDTEQLKQKRTTLQAEFEIFKETETNKIKEREKAYKEYKKMYDKDKKAIEQNYTEQKEIIETKLKEISKTKEDVANIPLISEHVITDLSAEIAAIEDEYGRLISEQQSALEKSTSMFEEKFGESSTVGKIVKWWKDNEDWVTAFLAGLVASFTAMKIVGVITNMMSLYQNSLLAVAIAEQGLAGVQTALNIVMSANPISTLIIAFGALVTAGVLLYKNWDFIKAKATKLWEHLKIVFSNISIAITETFVKIKEVSINIMESVKAFIADIITNIIDSFANITSTFMNLGENIIGSLLKGMKSSWGSITKWIGDKIGWLKNKLTFWNNDSGSTSNAFGGYRASGGPVSSNKSYIVGERGPELFTPSSSGNIIPNNQLGGREITMNISMAGANIRNREDADYLAQQFYLKQKQALREVGIRGTALSY